MTTEHKPHSRPDELGAGGVQGASARSSTEQPPSNQQSTQELVDCAWKAHSDAMMALAADVHPYSPSAVRDQEVLLERTLGELGTRLLSLEEQLEAQRELIEEAHRFALVLAELKVKTRPFAEAWLDKYHAAYPATSSEGALSEQAREPVSRGALPSEVPDPASNLPERIEERRNDPEFAERLSRSVEENKDILDKLAEGDSSPASEPHS